MTSDDMRFPIVGIGASAGGIQAIQELFKGIPADCGFGFVVVTHLSPNHESMLHEIIGRHTAMPVLVVADDMAVTIDTVHVMPGNAILTIDNGRLRLRRPNAVHRERNPIDIFLASLARDQGDYAVGIVLSGGGGDGTLGIKAIKEQGGLTFAQTSDGIAPLHPDMPIAAIATGMVDFAIPAHEMPEKLLTFRRAQADLGVLSDDDAVVRTRRTICDILRKTLGHDFSGYKTKTFMRRVHRRMQILLIDQLEAYVERLTSDHDEVRHLFRDLLINVTNFFRDADAFEALSTTIIPRMFEGRSADETVRVWVPGCATGEEVYSIGILMREHMDRLKVVPRVQIFATDIDDPALLVARVARYPETFLASVSLERRQRFFVQDGESFVVAKAVRDLCIFSPHSVIRDPPFSRIDLISCRNLLIYFGPDIQNQVVPLFHYALNPGGYLFLGTSENIGQFSDLFASLDKKQRIFQSGDHGGIKRLPAVISGPRAMPSVSGGAPNTPVPLRHVVEARVIDRFAPAHVVVNGEGDVIYCSQRTGKYLELPYGPPSRQLMAMAKKGLRLDLRSALHDAAETRRPVVRDHVAVDDDGEDAMSVKITIDPLPDRGAGGPLYLVLFEDTGRPETGPGTAAAERLPVEGVIANLERDLRDTRERLQSLIEDYETALEELKSSNEELVSVNEELQSTNEELEASKEELQSLNEELQTVNMELSGKLDDLDRANDDLKNLFESTQIATVFLDRDLVIRSFTPAVSRVFRLIPSDRGRPLTDLAVHPAYPALEPHVRQVFESGETIEHPIADPTSATRYLVRLIPYLDKDARIQGVVVTFVDVTAVVQTSGLSDETS